MATVIRPEISVKNQHHIPKHRYYELKHFVLQYPEWKKAYNDYSELYTSSIAFENHRGHYEPSDITARYAIKKAELKARIDLIEDTTIAADPELHNYLLRAVTEGLSFTYLKNTLGIPCGKDLYYKNYRRFFWLLSDARN